MNLRKRLTVRRGRAVQGIGLALCIGGLSACSGFEYERNKGLETQGTEFSKNLYAEYIDLSATEFSEYDYGDSDYFALKAGSAAQGNHVPPTAPGERDIPTEHQEEVAKAHARLVSVLDASARIKAPGVAANAQTQFDCWLQELAENLQPDHINACRSQFYSSLVAAEVALRPKPGPMAEPEPEAEIEPMPAAVMQDTFFIYFGHNSVEITPHSAGIIAKVVKSAETMKASTIYVVGHADTSGSSAYNENLAKKRSLEVARALLNAGGGNFSIDVKSSGESAPAYLTGDNIKKAGNRRVVVDIK